MVLVPVWGVGWWLLCFVGGLAGVVVLSRWVWGRVMYTNWGYAEPGVRVYMYYERDTVSLFWCVGVFVVTVCEGLFTLRGVTSIFDTCLPTICETNSLVLRLPMQGGRGFLLSTN